MQYKLGPASKDRIQDITFRIGSTKRWHNDPNAIYMVLFYYQSTFMDVI